MHEIVVKILKKKKGIANWTLDLVLPSAVFQLQILSVITDVHGRMQRIFLESR